MKKIVRIKFVRMSLLIILLLISMLIVVCIVNYNRLNAKVFDEGVKSLIDRSRHIKAKAGPDYQDEVLSKLPPNPNNGTYYRLDDMLGKAIVHQKLSTSSKPEVPKVIFSFEFDDPNRLSFKPALGQSTLQMKHGILRIEHHGSDYLINETPVQIPKDDIADIVIRARINKGNIMRLSWDTHSKLPKDSKLIWRKEIKINLVADNKFHTYVVNAKNLLKRHLKMNENIRRIFLSPSDVDGAILEIDFIRFSSKFAKYYEQSYGTGYETIGNEMRRVLYMLPTQTLKYSLKVPKRLPTLYLGNGVLIDKKPVNFEIFISDNHKKERLYANRVENASEWHDVRLNLSKWAGKQVQLSLRVSGFKNNVAFWSNPFISSEPKKRFNVIFILEDALRSDHLSINGYKLPTTPVKDKLFRKCGIIFPHAISQATWTRASVPSLMTSLLPTATGVWHFSDMLSDKYLTIAEILRGQGFVTASFIQNPNVGPWAGLHQGFSQIFDSVILKHETENIFGDRLTSWIASHHSQNFFLYLHILDPHGPYDPPVPYDRWYREAPSGGGTPVMHSQLDPKWIKHPTLEGRRLRYAGEIRHNDALLPRLIEKLKALGIFQNTLLVFMSDHGEHLGEHRLDLWDHRPPGFIQVINVPLNFVYPARFHKSKRILQTVQLIDVVPTVLELADIDTSNLLLQGDSLIDLIEDRRLSYWKNRIIASEEPHDMSISKREPQCSGSLFFRKWHLINSEHLFRGSVYLPAFLRFGIFNLEDNHDETHMTFSFLPDLYLKYKFAKIMTDLQSNDIAAWKKWTKGQDKYYKFDPDRLKRLRDLGYIK